VWLQSASSRTAKRAGDQLISQGESKKMRERDREIKRRRHRQEKRKRLRTKLAKANDAERPKIESQIRKTFPRYTPQV
jgi:Family of unknown function (DUF6800)